jgi:hypothetical protein
MSTQTQNGSVPVLTSQWGGLSPHLIASFFAVKKGSSDDKTTIRWERDMTQPEVQAPLTDGNAEVSLNWQSPFESVGADQKFSSFSALLQSGGFSSLISALQALLPKGSLDTASEKVRSMEGRTSFTKLNSTQVFTGMAPIKLSVTAHFRAYENSNKEVREPMDQLMAWALPKKLAQDGPASQALGGNLDVFPSEVPQIIGMKYGDMLWAPLVIESIPYPLTGTRDKRGALSHASLTMQLATLTALDKQDWNSVGKGRHFAQFSY